MFLITVQIPLAAVSQRSLEFLQVEGFCDSVVQKPREWADVVLGVPKQADRILQKELSVSDSSSIDDELSALGDCLLRAVTIGGEPPPEWEVIVFLYYSGGDQPLVRIAAASLNKLAKANADLAIDF